MIVMILIVFVIIMIMITINHLKFYGIVAYSCKPLFIFLISLCYSI